MTQMPNPPAEETEIGAWSAVWHALTGRSIAYFPRVANTGGSWSTIPDAEVIEKASLALKDISSTDSGLDGVISHARESLDEVKALTDYQDGKATRLLTIITFLSALAGVLFGKFVDLYPLHAVVARGGSEWWQQSLVFLTYLAFAVFALLAVCGAMVTFHAIRVRFRYPKTGQGGRAKSFLFYSGILGVQPSEWAASYVDADRTKLAADIRVRYLQNYVVESYLIAAKVADKIRYLVPAQSLLANATRVLVIWLVIFAATLVFVAPAEKDREIEPQPPAQTLSPEIVPPQT